MQDDCKGSYHHIQVPGKSLADREVRHASSFKKTFQRSNPKLPRTPKSLRSPKGQGLPELSHNVIASSRDGWEVSSFIWVALGPIPSPHTATVLIQASLNSMISTDLVFLPPGQPSTSGHITPLLKNLQWLLEALGINYKLPVWPAKLFTV